MNIDKTTGLSIKLEGWLSYVNLKSLLAGILTLGMSLTLLIPQQVGAFRQFQDYSWAKTIGNSLNDSGMSMDFDSSENIYFSGRFSSTVDFDPGVGTDEFTSQGGFDVFVTKFDSLGNYAWTKTFGGSGAEMNFGVVVDSSDNIYLANSFSTTVDFDPGVGTDEFTSQGGSDISLTKINADGSYGWTKTIGDTGTDNPMYMAIKQDEIYITGLYSSTVDFDPGVGTDEFTSQGSVDIFVTKFIADGSYAWTQSIGGSNTNNVSSLAIDSTDNVYIIGSFYENTDFDPGVGEDNHTVVDNQGDIYFTKLNSDGSYAWTKSVGSYGSDAGTGIAIDSNDNLYLTGGFKSTYDAIDFDTSGGTDEHSAQGGTDIFLTKYSADGSYAWTKTAGGASSDYGRSIAIDSQDNVFVVGEYYMTVDFRHGTGEDNHTSAGASDIFVYKIKSNGSYAWTQTLGGDNTDSVDSLGMSIDDDGSIYLAGQYKSTNADFNPGAGQDIHATSGNYDAYIVKLSARNYYHVTDLSEGIEAEIVDGGSVDDETEDDGVLAGEEETVRLLKDGDGPLADVTASFSADLDWSTVDADTDKDNGKAYVHSLTDAPGAADTYTLYVPYNTDDNAVTVCPGASSLDEVEADCPNATIYTEADSNVSIVTIDSEQFWQVEGLSSTGGLSTTIVLAATGTPWQILTQLTAGGMIFGAVYVVRTRTKETSAV